MRNWPRPRMSCRMRKRNSPNRRPGSRKSGRIPERNQRHPVRRRPRPPPHKAKGSKAAGKTTLASEKKAASAQPASTPSAKTQASNSDILQYQALLGQLQQLHQTEGVLRSKYTDANAIVQSNQRQIKELEKKRRDMEAAYPSLPDTVRSLGRRWRWWRRQCGVGSSVGKNASRRLRSPGRRAQAAAPKCTGEDQSTFRTSAANRGAGTERGIGRSELQILSGHPREGADRRGARSVKDAEHQRRPESFSADS